MKTETIDSTSNATEKVDVYSIITDRIISLLEAGTVPWQKPWTGIRNADGSAVMPANFVSKKAYRGVNVFLLSAVRFTCPYWLTYRQASELGGNVKKGEKGFPVVFWKRLIVEDKVTKERKVISMLRYYTVFNIEQCEGISWEKPAPIPAPETPSFNPIEECVRIVDAMPAKPDIRHLGNRACYSPFLDIVQMPVAESFEKPEAYYSTLFHELTHATGHKSRLDRKGISTELAGFGSETYSKEELVAEMGASFLCGFAGIVNSTIDNSAAYIASWLRKLKDDRKLVVFAAAQAQRASDFILGITFDKPDED